MNGFKTNKDYGYRVYMDENRDYADGHNLFVFKEDFTEVDAIKSILSGFIDTSSADEFAKFNDHSIDFAISVLDTFILKLTEQLKEGKKFLEDIEKEQNDISHKMIQPYLYGTSISIDEKLQIYELNEQVLIKRRKVKDSITIIEILLDNYTKSRNFILAMGKRKYSPKSEEYKNNKEFRINNAANIFRDKSENTRVMTDK